MRSFKLQRTLIISCILSVQSGAYFYYVISFPFIFTIIIGIYLTDNIPVREGFAITG